MANRIKKELENGNGHAVAVADKPEGKREVLTITPPKIEVMPIRIRGVAPYVQCAFPIKARQMIRDAQEAGSQSKKGKKREPKNFQQCYEQSMHRSSEGWYGIPANGLRKALVDACRLVDFKMTLGKQCLFVMADDFDPVDQTPLVRITKGEPKYVEHMGRNKDGSVDIRVRAMWDAGWEATVVLQYDADRFSRNDAVNLLHRVGCQVGIGEGRPFSRNSTGMGWGLFEILPE